MPDLEPSHPASSSPPARARPLGLPLIGVIALALLAVPRVALHDLGLIHERTGFNALLVFLPPLVWIVVALAARVPRVFITLLAIGVCYGIFLAIGHQLLWDIHVAGNPPQLGGNLAALDPAAQAVIFRTFAALSSLLTGVGVGVIAGLVAWGLKALIRRPRNGQ